MLKIQFKEKRMKRYYDFSARKLTGIMDARRMKKMAEKDFPTRVFRIRRTK